jgi:hypothetical protein
MESRKTRRVKRVTFDKGFLKDDPNFPNHFFIPSDGATKVSLLQIRMHHGGERMSEYILDIERLIENWIHIQIHLAEGLRILHIRGKAIGNFTFDNILVNDKNTPLIFKKLIKKSKLIISGSCSFFFKKSMKSTISF